MDLNNLLGSLGGGKSAEGTKEGTNNGANNNMLQSILPLLMGGKQNPADLMGMLGKNNPNMSNIMSLLPQLQAMGGSSSQNTRKKKTKKTTDDFVKVSDYYKK